ncbi:DUF262 domain-containing protein [Tardiphaga sp. 813_E8_N1_3]|uniref:DUF262 domain-containing protein n=1 Tax=Tardiphaga sp. 813_E8_N1_3 TaxID=3240760 RepID=UPI003F1E5F03
MNIKPYDSKIGTLFSSAFYKIPRFQRPYSWDKGNVEDFWSDVITSEKADHFIGSMVVYSGQNQEKFVVDGQQRLTTIVIFMAALRDTLEEEGEAQLAKGVQGIIERQDITAEMRYVLRSETSYPYFQEHVLKFGSAEIDDKPSDEERGIQSAYDFAKAGFASRVEEIRAGNGSKATKTGAVRKALEKYRNFLLDLDVIIIELDTEDAAYIVFETLNTRGRDLEPKDLIKNLLTKLLPKKSEVDQTRHKWDVMLKSLSESAADLDTSTYLHHHWLSKFDYTPARTLFKAVKAHVKKANAADYLNDLTGDVNAYRRIFEPENFNWTKERDPIRRSLLALKIFKVRQPTPMVLSILRALNSKKISFKQARDTIAAIEKFHFMYTAIAGQSSSGGVSKMYAAAARDLTIETNEQRRAKHLQDFRTKLRDKLPEKSAFLAGLRELRFSASDTRDRPLVRYVLEQVDASLRKDAAADYSKMTIEHIAPQNPSDSNKPNSLYAAVGNLILVSDGLNGKLKNKVFAEKKKILVHSKLPMDAVLTKAAVIWGNAQITERSEAMATLLHSS